jgi:hypothetical protein
MENYIECLKLEQKLIEIEKMLETFDILDKCGNCKRPITDWEDVEFTGDKVILTHKCECGRYVEIHNKVVFDKIVVVEEGEAA